MKTRKGSLNYIWYVSATLLLFAGATAVHAQTPSNARISITSEGSASQRSELTDNAGSLDELEPLLTTGSRSGSTRSSNQKTSSTDALKPGSASQSVIANVDFWFYDVDVALSSDFDRDGYYSSIDLTFDADTVYSVADVYAVIYLSLDYGPWNEYAVTGDFTIYGASGDDEYFVETDLVAGYVSGDYDVLIELFDTYDGSFVASVGPDENAKLSFLPLEDAGRDTPPGTTVIINEGGGGSFGWLSLLALLGVLGAGRFSASRGS